MNTKVCDAKPTVTFPVAGHYRLLAGTKLHCLVTEAQVCVQLVRCFYLKAQRPELKPYLLSREVQCRNHYTTISHKRRRLENNGAF